MGQADGTGLFGTDAGAPVRDPCLSLQLPSCSGQGGFLEKASLGLPKLLTGQGGSGSWPRLHLLPPPLGHRTEPADMLSGREAVLSATPVASRGTRPFQASGVRALPGGLVRRWITVGDPPQGRAALRQPLKGKGSCLAIVHSRLARMPGEHLFLWGSAGRAERWALALVLLAASREASGA